MMHQRAKTKTQRLTKKIREGDTVVVVTGNSKGQSGKVLRFQGGDRVIVEGVNMRKKHVKPSEQNKRGGVIDFEAPIHISNVALCDSSGKKLKVFVQCDANGGRALVYKKEGEVVVHRSLKK